MEKAFILWSYVFFKYFLNVNVLLLLIKKYVFLFWRNCLGGEKTAEEKNAILI